jgi:hypothetical protein
MRMATSSRNAIMDQMAVRLKTLMMGMTIRVLVLHTRMTGIGLKSHQGSRPDRLSQENEYA